MHLPLQAADVSIAEVLAELLDLLEFEQVYPEHLYRLDHETVDFGFVRQERFPVPLLVLDERLYVQVEGVARLRIRRLGREFASLEEQREQREKRVSEKQSRCFVKAIIDNLFVFLLVDGPLVGLELGLVGVGWCEHCVGSERRLLLLLRGGGRFRWHAQHRALHPAIHHIFYLGFAKVRP